MTADFHIHLRNGETFTSKADYAAACGYSLSYVLQLRRRGLGWDAIWNRKRNGTPAQRAKLKRKIRRMAKDMSLFEPVEE
ncbi:hypothetical protein BMB17_004965 [Escherichia coli]|nr:hypothetical protein [Escherichia coli]